MFKFTSKNGNIVTTNMYFDGKFIYLATNKISSNIFYRLTTKQYVWNHSVLGYVIPDQNLFSKFLG